MSWPRCEIVRKDGTVCQSSAAPNPEGGALKLCAGHLRLRRQRAIADELASRANGAGITGLLERVDQDASDLSTEELAFALAGVQK